MDGLSMDQRFILTNYGIAMPDGVADLREVIRLAQEQAWNDGWARAMVRIEVDGEVQPESNPYTQGDKQA